MRSSLTACESGCAEAGPAPAKQNANTQSENVSTRCMRQAPFITAQRTTEDSLVRAKFPKDETSTLPAALVGAGARRDTARSALG